MKTVINFFLIVPLFLLSFNVPAVDNLWSLGSTCSTHGPWAQNALKHLNSLMSVIKMYRDDDACKSEISEAVKGFGDLENSIRILMKSEKTDVDRIQGYINELVLLHDDADTPYEEDFYNNLIANASVELGAARAGYGQYNQLSVEQELRKQAISRIYNYMGPAVRSLPSKECLVKKPNQVLPLIASLIQVASSFAGAPYALAGTLAAKLIVYIVEYLRDRTFKAALEIGELTKLRSSVQCAIETLSQDYCAASDMQKVLYWETRDPHQYIEISPDSYWAGYMVYNVYFPKVLNWLSKTIGFLDPTRDVDIQEQMKALGMENQVRITYQLLTSVLKLSERNFDLDADTDIKKIKAIVYTLLALDSSVTGVHRAQVVPNKTYHISSTFQALFTHEKYNLNSFIYWWIDWPLSQVQNPHCQVIVPSGGTCDWERNLTPIIKQKYGKNPKRFFTDMSEKISSFKKLISPALDKILDKVRAKDKIVIMANAYDKSPERGELSVFEGLKFIEDYLYHLKSNLRKNPEWKNPVLKALLIRLLPKLREVNKGMKEFKKYVQDFDPSSSSSSTYVKDIMEINKRAKALLDKIALELHLQEDRERFITTNIRKIVDNDYNTRIKIRDFGDDPRSIIRISKGNLISTTKQMTSAASDFLSISEARDISEEGLKSLLMVFDDALLDALKHYRKKEKYDNRMHTSYNLRSRLCILLMAFPRWPDNIDFNLCRGSVLMSVYNIYIPKSSWASDYAKFRKSLNVYFDRNTQLPFEDRVCLFHNYLKRDKMFRYYRNIKN